MKVFLLLILSLAVAESYQKDANWGLTPGGWKHKSCCHHVPSGSRLIENKFGVVVVYPPTSAAYELPPCKFPGLRPSKPSQSVEGWHVYTQQNVGSNLTAFLGQWNVPDLPQSDDGQTLFMFTGVQNINWVPPNPGPNGPFDIIQPVLQYGPSEAGGGSYWTLASWYVPLNGDSAVWSDLITVNVGDTIFGNMTKLSSTGWYINGVQVGGQNTDLSISRPRLISQPWAYVTLEVYDLYQCSDYPTVPLNFQDLQLFVDGQPEPFQWQTVSQDSSCKQQATVVSPSNVIIDW